MSILVDPQNLLRRMAPKTKVRRLVTRKLTLNQVVLRTLAHSGLLTKGGLERVALKVIRQYKRSYAQEIKAGASKAQALETALNQKRLMVQRVQSAAVREIVGEVKDRYRGEFYIWLPSSSDSPDPEHELFYGEKRQVGVGEMPGDRPGCQCAMELLVNDTKLEL